MLTTKRPTPTTVLYTVSTRSAPTTLAAHLRDALTTLLRLASGLLVLAALYLELHHFWTGCLPTNIQTHLSSLSPPPPTTSPPSTQPNPLLPHPALRATLYALILYLVQRKAHASESLLVIRGLGVQTATAGSSLLWGGGTRFIPASAVQDVFIHEAFEGFEVRFYLGIVVEGEGGVVVVFPVSFYLVSS